MKLCFALSAAALFLAAEFAPQAFALPPPAGPEDWAAIDVVPMPKHVRRTGRVLPLSVAAIVLGEHPSRQDEIGADWIRDKFAAAGAPVPPVHTFAEPLPQTGLRIWVGTRETNPGIERAAAQGLFRLGPGVPGRRGYVIHPVEYPGGTDLFLGGADEVGALYACVTLAGLMEGGADGPGLLEAEIADWPDLWALTDRASPPSLHDPERMDVGRRLLRASDPSEELVQEFHERMREHVDRLLGWKFGAFHARALRMALRGLPREGEEAFFREYRKVIEYAAERGLRTLIYALHPAAGFRSELPEEQHVCLTTTAVGLERYPDVVRCWSMDGPTRRNAARLGERLAALGAVDVGFHDWDTGGFFNPAQWGERCAACRERWGDDFAAATINQHRIYYDEIMARAPDVRLHFTLYPYQLDVMTQEGAERHLAARFGPGPNVPETARRLVEQYAGFWRRMAEAFPQEVTFCIRENTPENVRRFHELTAPHGTFAWYKVGSEQWAAFFDESPRWAPTFFSGRDDFMLNVTLERFLPLKALAVREYTWNVRAPGAAGWAQLEPMERWRHAEPEGEIYEIVLPHVVRNVFGRRAAPEIVESLSANVAFNPIFYHTLDRRARRRAVPWLTSAERWMWQAEQAAAASDAMERGFARFAASPDRLGMTPFAARRLVYMREAFQSARWMALAMGFNAQARELAQEGKLDEALEAVAKGVEAAESGEEAMRRLVAERPDDPIYNVEGRRPARWKAYTPGNKVDYGHPMALLEQTAAEAPALAAAGLLPERVLNALARRDRIHVLQAETPPTVDGRLDEEVWRAALPAESFFVHRGEGALARAHTSARFLLHGDRLYVGFVCWMPGDAPVQAEERPRDARVMDDEVAEVFLMPPHWGGAYCQFQINAAGSLADKKVTFVPGEAGGMVRRNEPEWDAKGVEIATQVFEGRWELEVSLPLATLGATGLGGHWRANVARGFKGRAGEREFSSVLASEARNFHDTDHFHRLIISPEPAPPPEAEIALTAFRSETRTFDDRVATSCEFSLAVRSSRPLRNVQVVAETYDEAGVLHQRRTLAAVPHLMYEWAPDEEFAAEFEGAVERGAVRVAVESEEASVERWIRLGGWGGTEALAPLFAREGDELGGRPFLGPSDMVHFPGQVEHPATGDLLRILPQGRGTVEFRFRPSWRMAHPAERRPAWSPRRALFHSGILRYAHPEAVNADCMVVYCDEERDTLHFAVRLARYAGWAVSWRAEDAAAWRSPRWRHVAFVWDGEADPADQLRAYVDGRRVSGALRLFREERMGEDMSVRLDERAYAMQLGGLNTGRWPARAAVSDLRVSRSARYGEDFAPPEGPLQLDADTAALFRLDGDLAGEGVAEDGTRYSLAGAPGPLEWR